MKRQCSAMDLHSRSALLDGARILQPILSFHVCWKEVHSPLQELYFHPATPGESFFKFQNCYNTIFEIHQLMCHYLWWWSIGYYRKKRPNWVHACATARRIMIVLPFWTTWIGCVSTRCGRQRQQRRPPPSPHHIILKQRRRGAG